MFYSIIKLLLKFYTLPIPFFQLFVVHPCIVPLKHQVFFSVSSLVTCPSSHRSEEAVLWGHRHSNTETFYQVGAAPRPGLPIPSDVMAKVPHRARRRLDRDHNITLL